MGFRRPGVALIAFATGLGGWLGGAYAQPDPTQPPSTSVNDEARAAFDAGLAAESSGNLTTACTAFRKSLGLVRELGPLRKVATCDLQQGKVVSAAAELQELLGRLPPEDPERGAIEAQLDTAKRRIARVKVQLGSKAPAGAKLRLDADTATPGVEIAIDPGPHEIVLEVPSKEPIVTRIDLADGSVQTIVVPKEAPSEPTRPVIVPKKGSKGLGGVQIAGLLAGGVGVAGFVLAGATGIKLLLDHSEFEDCQATPGCDAQAIADRAEPLLIANAWGFGIGAVGLGVGAALLIAGAVSTPDEAPVQASVGLGGASLRVRF